MEKSIDRVKVIGVGALGGQVINLLLKTDLRTVAEKAVYIDQELLIDSDRGNIYFFKEDGVEQRDLIPKIKTLKKYVWPGDEYLGQVLSGVDLVILIIMLGGPEGVHWSKLISEVSKEMGIPLIVLATLPLSFEGKQTQKVTQVTVEKLRQSPDWVLLFPLDRLLIEYPQEASLSGLLKKIDEKLGGIVEEILEQVSLIAGDRNKAALSKSLIEMNGCFKEFEAKWGVIPSKGLLEGELIGQKHPIFFDEV